MFGLSPIVTKLIGAAIAALLVIGLYYGARHYFTAGLVAQSKVDQGQSGAFHNSASDAVDTIGNVSANQAAGVEIGRQNEEEIRNAKGSDVRVHPDANAAGLRALCRRASHRNDPACRVQHPRPE